MKSNTLIKLGCLLVLSSFASLLIGQQPDAYWRFDGSNPWQDKQKQLSLKAEPFLEISEDKPLVGRYLHFKSEAVDQVHFQLPVQSAVTIEYWFRFPAYDYRLPVRFFWTPYAAILVKMNTQILRFQTNTLTQEGKSVGDDFRIPLNGTGPASLTYYLDGNWHHMVCKFDARRGIKEIWIDGICPPGFSKKVAASGKIGVPERKQLPLFFTDDNESFHGDLDEIAIYHRFLPAEIHQQHVSESRSQQAYSFTRRRSIDLPSTPAPVTEAAGMQIDLREFAPGHPRPRLSPTEQLARFPLPRYLPGHSLHHQVNWMGLNYFAGSALDGVSTEEMRQNALAIQAALCKDWHYMITLQNSKLIHTNRRTGTANLLTLDLINFANRHPEYPLAVLTLWGQVDPRHVGRREADGYVKSKGLPAENYLRDRQGRYLKRDGSYSRSPVSLSPAADLKWMQEDGAIQKYYLGLMLNRLSRPIDLINENGEVPFLPYPQLTLERDARLGQVGATSQSEWDQYQARQKTALRIAYRDAFMKTLPQLAQTTFTWYGVDGGPLNQDRFAWAEARRIHSPINGQYYSTPDFYVRWPGNWRKWRGAWRGWAWLSASRKAEIPLGDKLFSPFVAAGWSTNPADNVRPSQWLGLLKCLGPIGAEFHYTGFFNTGRGDRVFPDPHHYTWQAVMPSYAQAITSRYETELRTGDLLSDEQGLPMVEIWAGDPQILAVVRKARDAERYILALTLQPNSNQKGNVPDSAKAILRFDGQELHCTARRQGSVYMLDRSNPDGVIWCQLDSWHEAGHPLRWRPDFLFEAENYDFSQSVARITERPSSTPPQDFTQWTTYLQANGEEACAKFHFQPREKRSYRLQLRMRNTGPGRGQIALLLDGELFETISLNPDQNWQQLKVENRRLEHLSAESHMLTIKFLDSQLQLDRFFLQAQ